MPETETKAKQEGAGALTPAERAARLQRAETLVKDHMLMSGAVGLIPAPGFDIVAGIGVQLALLKRLADLYSVPFSEHAARGIILTLLGGVGVGALAGGILMSAMKFLPGAGTVFGVITMPISLAAVTYAIGKLFVAHFEIGGTLDDFDARAKRPYFRDLVQRGRHVASTMTPSTPPPAPAKP